FLAVALTDPSTGARLAAERVPAAVAAIAAAGAIVHPGVDGIQLIPAYGYGDAEMVELDTAIRAGLARMAEGAS
ncbi:aspartate aminotransferase family protein, partial [Microbacterium enclense]|nr:aspartate aminotransferase family protein [Microbacterium enclense]